MSQVLLKRVPFGALRSTIIGGLSLAFAISYLTPSIDVSLPEALSEPPTKIELSTPVILEEIRSSAKLLTTTAPGHIEMSYGIPSTSIWQDPFYMDYVQIFAYGEVLAGFALENITEADIEQGESEVVVHLGTSQVITTRLDNQLTHVVAKDAGVFKRLFGRTNIHLEGDARLDAERRITASVCKQALADAVKNGVQEFLPALQAFFRAKGDKRLVRVVAEAGTC